LKWIDHNMQHEQHDLFRKNKTKFYQQRLMDTANVKKKLQ